MMEKSLVGDGHAGRGDGAEHSGTGRSPRSGTVLQDVPSRSDDIRSNYEDMRLMYHRGCVFCDAHPLLALWRSQIFQVTLDVAPLATGHVMINSRSHWGCAGEVPSEHMEELRALKDFVRRGLLGVFGCVTFYEHGRAGGCMPRSFDERTCHHFHLHAVPSPGAVIGLLAKRFRAVPMRDLAEVTSLFARFGNYLMVEEMSGAAAFFPADGRLEAHLLRTLIAEMAGHPEKSDWSTYRDAEAVALGYDLLAAHFRDAEIQG